MPRSPSRDLADRFAGNRGYFHRPDALRRGRYALAILALVAVAGWAVVDVVRPSAVAAHTHGRLAGPHSALDENCAACHAPHTLGELGPASLFQTHDRWHDLTCERCHAGPAHHAAVTAAGHEFHTRCENCHHDHAGRSNSLVRITDDHCTRCHASLPAHHATGNSPFAARVTDFAKDHPEFRPATDDPKRTLKFSHAVHMTPGLPYTPGGKESLTLRRAENLFGAATAGRYRKSGQGPDDLVTLDCASCHRLDSAAGTPAFDELRAALERSGEPTRAILPPRAAGAYFLPVDFEAHCRACHPLQAPAGTSGGRVIPEFALPHRRQPDRLREEITAGYVRQLVATDHPALSAPAEPGGFLAPRLRASHTLRTETARLTDTALEFLTRQDTCVKCHDVGGPAPGTIAPVADRTVWFTHAKFDHTAHRAVSCSACHPGPTAGLPPDGRLIDKEPPQLPGIETCRACHAPAGTRVERPGGEAFAGGGVRHGCTDCHGYHNNDHPLQGRGAPTRAPADPLTPGAFFGVSKDRP